MARALVLAALGVALLPTIPAVAGPPDVDSELRTGASASRDAAVVVGIEDYAFLPGVPYAERDAEAFYSLLVYTLGVPPHRVGFLKGTATADDILDAVEEAAEQAGRGGTLWVYFAGHGAASPVDGERVLLGVDTQANVESVERRALPVDRLADAMEESSASRLILVLDACYAGVGRDGEELFEGQRVLVPSHAVEDRNDVLLWSATTENELSGPYEDAGHGLFTYFVVGALRGWADGEMDGEPDGRVTLDEAQAYVTNATRVLGQGAQRPTMTEDLDRMAWDLLDSDRLEQGPDLAQLAMGDRRRDDGGPVDHDLDDTIAARKDELARREEEQQVAREELAWILDQPMGDESRKLLELFVDKYGASRPRGTEPLAEVERARIELDKYRARGPQGGAWFSYSFCPGTPLYGQHLTHASLEGQFVLGYRVGKRGSRGSRAWNFLVYGGGGWTYWEQQLDVRGDDSPTGSQFKGEDGAFAQDVKRHALVEAGVGQFLATSAPKGNRVGLLVTEGLSLGIGTRTQRYCDWLWGGDHDECYSWNLSLDEVPGMFVDLDLSAMLLVHTRSGFTFAAGVRVIQPLSFRYAPMIGPVFKVGGMRFVQ